MTALLTDNLPLLAIAPNGIKKLRELILELAVRGKLVPQDPNDEPASALLERIAEEKMRLTVEGKIRKNDCQDDVVGEVPYPIPVSWAFASLGQVVEIVRGITFPASEKSKEPGLGRVACLRTANVQGEIEWDDLLYIRDNFVSRLDQYIQPFDIVMSMANSRELVGKVALVGAVLAKPTTFGGFLGVLRPVFIEPRFVMALLRTPHARSVLIDSASQTTNIANVSLAKLRPLLVAIPPLAEQRRIVAKVDELMGLCDRLEAQQADAEVAHMRLVQALLDSLTQATDAADFASSWKRLSEHFHLLFTTGLSIDALKTTLLQLAVMGKLVAQDPNDEPAFELLQRVASERARLIIDGRIRKENSKSYVAANLGIFEVPSSWEWTIFNDLIDPEFPVAYGVLVPGPDVAGGVPFVRIADLDLVAPPEKPGKSISPEVDRQFERTRIVGGEILMGVVGSIGKLGVAPESWAGANIARAICRVVPSKHVLKSYMLWLLQSDLMREQFIGETRTLAQPTLNVGLIRLASVPLPPLAEQHRIVAKVDQLMDLCNQLKANIEKASAISDCVVDSIVAAAISHRLVASPSNVINLSSFLVRKLASRPTFGRTAHMKWLFLADQHLGLELGMTYERQAAGPLDKLIYQIEEQAVQSQLYAIQKETLKSGVEKIAYRPDVAIDRAADAGAAELGDKRAELDRLIGLLGGHKTEDLEIVATLYAVWNDALAEGQQPDDGWLINEFRTNWHKGKERFSPELLAKWLSWMREHRLVPVGKISSTRHQGSLLH